jgi:hypothetical protein
MQNGGSGWRVSLDKMCVGRECGDKDKLGVSLKVNKVSVENPSQAVLLRDGKASFLELNNQNPKLGLLSVNTIPIERKFLQSNDILIIGSDGKDDIELSSNSEGRSINEDETAILELIEKSEGNLKKLEMLLEEKGTLIDDLSIMSISIS